MLILNWSKLPEWREVAIANHSRLAVETAHPRFIHPLVGPYSLVLSVNSGYE